MDKQLVGELPDITESSNDDEIMVITDSQHNQLRKEKISNFIKDLVSNDENNGIKLGTDNKLLSVDASNADNITSGILNPERLPNSGVTEDTYVYPDSITVDKKGRVTKITNGTPGGNNADKDLSNITEAGKDVIRDTAGSGFSLFDVVEKDHILSFEESMGFGLLGTYVYKEPVAGSRYGYPDFYNRCVEEFEEGTPKVIPMLANVHNTGCKINSNFIVSGFSSRNFVQPTSGFYPNYYKGQPFEMGVKLNVTALSGIQTFIGSGDGVDFCGILMQFSDNKLRIGVTNNGTSWNIVNLPAGTNTYSIDTDYWFKFEYTGTKYIASYSTDGETYTPDIEIENSTAPSIRSCALGNNLHGTNQQDPLQGTIDLKECYIKINNETVWQGTSNLSLNKHPNGHIFYDIADKATVDEIFSQRGEAWFYGVDTENERVFLPRGTRSQYTVNTDETGDYVEAGLPNITGTMTADISEGVATGALKIDTIYPGAMWSGSTNVARMRNWSLDASLSNPIYGNSDTVQPYATKKLLYIVVGNVKVQSAASDVVDVTTTENDTLPLFYNFYAKDEDMADAVSFVKSTGTFLGGNLYPTAYEKLVARVGTGNVKAHTDDYTDYDFVVNQDEMTFRLPLKNGKEVLPGNETVNTLGFSANPTNNVEEYIVPYNGYITIIGYKQSTANTLNVMLNGVIVSQTRALVGGLSSESYFFAKKGDRVTVFTDSASTGWAIATQTITKAIGDGNLYYKLLNAVVNQELADFAHIQTELNTKLSRSDKEEIVSWGMPDYSAGVSKTIGDNHVAPTDGVVSFSGYSTRTTAAIFYVNDVKLTYAAPDGQMDTSSQILIPKGSTYRLTTANNTYSNSFLTFYPLKGAN